MKQLKQESQGSKSKNQRDQQQIVLEPRHRHQVSQETDRKLGTTYSQTTLLQNSTSTHNNFDANKQIMDLNEIETGRNTGRNEQTQSSRHSSSNSRQAACPNEPDVENLKKIQEDLISKLRETESLISSLSTKHKMQHASPKKENPPTKSVSELRELNQVDEERYKRLK